MKQKHKLTSQEQEQVSETHTQKTEAREFATAEELIRHDAGQTEVPPAVAQRLGESIQKEPRPRRSLWQRLTGR
jgi:peptidyl-tRNA hydrolase